MFVSQRYIAPAGTVRDENEFFSQTGPKSFTRRDYNKLARHDKEKMRKRIEEAREKMMDAFEHLPHQLFLVLRYARFPPS